jgi:phosphoesterase RecJ-like protein
MTIDWEPLRPIIHENQRFVLSSHVRPDADALGSELALAGLLEASPCGSSTLPKSPNI